MIKPLYAVEIEQLFSTGRILRTSAVVPSGHELL